ncbi:D-amino acid dehydrogenase [Neisseria animalis]|uniref:D-amino acid dehydrogenase n=1 Tax=Neisseria animalis TaxID=492 RepID=A0A5P3MNX7_NEIAN|nr:D-amino acid dehydrogenase [Neisseria animalis]QEY23110.1 D-amino acid dehydrogenase [Neisseria animalis]ROW32442.1 D-amino acid dehydrogenase [Neisseria animalis]VEE08154.1 D-amino acid dehydrogenase small subunit [Neisseria animalis]
MKTVVLGAGIAGISTAWYLLQQGHEVTVIDRAEAAAMETSFANAGQLSYGYTTPWAAPGIPAKAAKWLFRQHSPLILKADGSLFQLQWLMQMLQNCTTERYQTNKERMVRISEYSREMFRRFEAETGMDFEGRKKGTLQIFRSTKEVEAAEKDIEVLAEYGVPYQRLKPEECLQHEPALHHALGKIAGALHLPNDATGDCHLFASRLKNLCEAKGAVFKFGHAVERFEHNGKQIQAVYAGGERFEAERFVCALGSFSRTVLADLGLKLPIYPVKGYSLTLPVTDGNEAPVSTILDETYKVAITRFDKRIRVGGMAELSGYGLSLPPERRETLALVVNDLYPKGGDLEKAEFWTGLRPMTPDSTPIIGAAGFNNLFLNTGHGTLGWTMSLGSAKITADLVCGITPEVRSDDLALSRYA